jgi:hypothetical protein
MSKPLHIGDKLSLKVVTRITEQGFNDYNDFMLEKSNMSELQKRLEKIAYRHFCHNVFVALTCRLAITGQLES